MIGTGAGCLGTGKKPRNHKSSKQASNKEFGWLRQKEEPLAFCQAVDASIIFQMQKVMFTQVENSNGLQNDFVKII
uniref:Uncharacterized protein n=1 Tax=Romanomermis culicivorax TaxID=13658 RepID=A0A915J995_ROMCU